MNVDACSMHFPRLHDSRLLHSRSIDWMKLSHSTIWVWKSESNLFLSKRKSRPTTKFKPKIKYSQFESSSPDVNRVQIRFKSWGQPSLSQQIMMMMYGARKYDVSYAFRRLSLSYCPFNFAYLWRRRCPPHTHTHISPALFVSNEFASRQIESKTRRKETNFIYLRFGAVSNESICSVLCIFSCGFALAPSHSISFVRTNGERVVNDSNLWRAVAYIFIVNWIARTSNNCICPIPPVRIWFRLRRVQFKWSDRLLLIRIRKWRRFTKTILVTELTSDQHQVINCW